MNNLFENVYDVIFTPLAALRRIAGKRPVWQAVLVFLVSVLVPVLPMYFTMPLQKAHLAASMFTGVQLIFSLFVWFTGAAVWGLLAEFFGGAGSSSSLFVALGFTHIPRVLLVPGLAIAGLLPDAIRPVIEVLLFGGVLLWLAVLDVIAIRAAYSLSGAKSVLVFLTPLLVVIVLAVLAVIAVGTMMWQLLLSLDNVLVE